MAVQYYFIHLTVFSLLKNLKEVFCLCVPVSLCVPVCTHSLAHTYGYNCVIINNSVIVII